MKGLTMLTVVINALVQQEEMVTVITFLLYKCLNSLIESPRTGMCTTQNGTTNQGPRVRILIHIMHTRHIMSSILITGRNVQGEMSALRCPLYAARHHLAQHTPHSCGVYHIWFPLNQIPVQLYLILDLRDEAWLVYRAFKRLVAGRLHVFKS